MVAWYINELSLDAQFGSVSDFLNDLLPLLSLRRFDWIGPRLFCSRRGLHDRLVTPAMSFSQMIYSLPRDVRAVVLTWIDRLGPFVDDEPTHEPNNYFQFNGVEVTNLSLGEAARRKMANAQSIAFSFGQHPVFSAETLCIQHGLDEEPYGYIQLENVNNARALYKRSVEELPPLSTYVEYLAHWRHRFDRLQLGPDIDTALGGMPLQKTVTAGVTDLLEILQDFMENRNDDGSCTERGHAILNEFFRKNNAWFSDESSTNKHQFQALLTFRDPGSHGVRVTYYWHGKIQTPQVRLYFEWPVPVGQSVLKVGYIGPKITKK